MKLLTLLLFVACCFSQDANLGSAQVRRMGEITLHAPLEKVFPLFGPVDEAKWAPGWQASIKHGGNAEVGTVFTTDASGHQAMWIVSRYEEERRAIQYTVVFPEDRVVQIDIECQFRNANETRCHRVCDDCSERSGSKNGESIHAREARPASRSLSNGHQSLPSDR